ncbi:type II toxin-antitoxin system RelE/ParE family toxin [Variovorax sp. EBFNA2]|uniref:type II toxin-antitoxin system RelE/ParE family toxin n=1 Tax=Variovorax sp. EBFNA2 TaxID=3342097 RepID=UPI0029C03F20|nr:type II toxin-antitoxin system RelE/ParE family toxin [Variovorax boronicumulans]WPG35025.1 type II toxin-antitoxin system RelE/ParE family toxin [Variovorax boronicumulans]
MASAKAVVRFTANFETNLAQIADFWGAAGALHAYEQLLEALGDTVIGNLESHPRIGRRFFARTAHSLEVRQRLAALTQRHDGAEVREYLSGDYLLLYRVADDNHQTTVDLLAIRHHRQLSFDFEGFWQVNRSEDD